MAFFTGSLPAGLGDAVNKAFTGTGNSTPFTWNMANSVGRPITQWTIGDLDTAEQFAYSVTTVFYAGTAARKHAIWKVIEVKALEKAGNKMTASITQMPSTSLEMRPVGAGGSSSFHTTTRVETSLKRRGQGIEVNFDALETPAGQKDLALRLRMLSDAVYNSMMEFAMQALTQEGTDILSTMKFQARREDLPTVQKQGSILARELVGCINTHTGAIHTIVSVFNTLFAFYSTGVKFIIVTPEIAEYLCTRPFVEDGIPTLRLDVNGPLGGKVGIGMASETIPMDNQGPQVIVVPKVPSGLTGRMVQYLSNWVYASGYAKLDTGVVMGDGPSSAFPNQVRLYDCQRNQFVTKQALDGLQGDYFLQNPGSFFVHNYNPAAGIADITRFIENNISVHAGRGHKAQFGHVVGALRVVGGMGPGPDKDRAAMNLASAIASLVTNTQHGLDFTNSPWGLSVDSFAAKDASEFAICINDAHWVGVNAATNALKDSWDVLNAAWTAHGADQDMKSVWEELVRLKAPNVCFMAPAVQTATIKRMGSLPLAFSRIRHDVPLNERWMWVGAGVRVEDFITTGWCCALPPAGAPLAGQESGTALFTWCQRNNWAPASYLFLWAYHHAEAHKLIVASDVLGVLGMAGELTKSGADAVASRMTLQYSIRMGVLITRRDCMGVMSKAHLIRDGIGGGTDVIQFTSDAAKRKQAAMALRKTNGGPPTQACLLAVPIMPGSVDNYAHLRWLDAAERHGFATPGTLVPVHAAEDAVASFMAFMELKPTLQPAGAAPPKNTTERIAPICTAYEDNGKAVFTFAPVSSTLLADGREVSTRPGNHPYGVTLVPADAYSTSGKPGSARPEERHGTFITRPLTA